MKPERPRLVRVTYTARVMSKSAADAAKRAAEIAARSGHAAVGVEVLSEPEALAVWRSRGE